MGDRFFASIDLQFEAQGFLPSNPCIAALAYLCEWREGRAPDSTIDINHRERLLAGISIGRRNGSYLWTELAAQPIGMVQSSRVACRLHDINPYDDFVEVLLRISQHPALSSAAADTAGVETVIRW